MVRATTPITLDDLRRMTVAQSLFPPTTLKRALRRFGFVQADPIRAPARAQDLILRHRVKDYRAGDLERRYSKLGVEEDFFINYGFVTSAIHALMHPRLAAMPKPGEQYKDPMRMNWPAERRKKAEALLEFIRERGSAHPREVDDHFSHGSVRNYWGGSSNATTHLLDAMHYSGLLRVMRREDGIRIYAARELAVERPSVQGSRLLSSADIQAMKPQQRRRLADQTPSDNDVRRAQIDTLVDVAIRIYAPLTRASLSILVNRLRFAVPQWHNELKDSLQRAKQRLSHTQLDGIDWYWPATRDAARGSPEDSVRLLTPFDPVVWDRAR
ncbi:MAG TPA: crosslink repair DNA glycosylase YcaQ family protein, partial [Candidatus Dormibacteraeota bacterium]|nr:crosslink repair DNA glycosylase YcaQ family protein [Candidatus Dormibacteraeota bacterium]